MQPVPVHPTGTSGADPARGTTRPFAECLLHGCCLMQSTWVSASETLGTPAEKRDLRSILWMGKLSPAVGTGVGLLRVGLSGRTASRVHRSVATARSRACAFWFVQLAHSYRILSCPRCSDARWHPKATGGMTRRRRPKATEQEVCFLLPACHSYLIPTAGRPILS